MARACTGQHVDQYYLLFLELCPLMPSPERSCTASYSRAHSLDGQDFTATRS
jgi:hypothetical protein